VRHFDRGWRTEPLMHRSGDKNREENEPSHRRSAFATVVVVVWTFHLALQFLLDTNRRNTAV
jgi:hypothetical protein